MTTRPPLTFAGGAVDLVHRKNCGRVRVVYLDRAGQPTRHHADAWPHELRGVGWHLGEIKRLIARLPDSRGALLPQPPNHPAYLFAHHVADHQRED